VLLDEYTMEISSPECLPSAVTVAATIEFDDDLTELLPLLNAEVGPCVFEPDMPFLRFSRDGKPIAVYPTRILIAGLRDKEDAEELFAWLRETINAVFRRKADIEPSYFSLSRVRPLDVFKLLPKTNCGDCGKASCIAFAAALATGEAGPADCPALLCDQSEAQRTRLLELFSERD
jgi:ArsR family metal-binding transcriptional regulator